MGWLCPVHSSLIHNWPKLTGPVLIGLQIYKTDPTIMDYVD